MFEQDAPSPIQEIHDPFLSEKGITLLIKREDLLHSEVSGNKWRKLKYNLLAAKKEGHDTLLTFGGAYSNHIHATAAAASDMGFKSIGIIRGEERLPLNETLKFATRKGMRLEYMARDKYREKGAPENIEALERKFGEFYLVPEGGTNSLAIQGCEEIIKDIAVPFDYICCAAGTGGTVSGLIAGLDGHHHVLGFSALKGSFLQKTVTQLLAEVKGKIYDNWQIMDDYHFGGYARINHSLIDFIRDFWKKHHILLDPIYTGKMMYGIYDLAQKGHFSPGSRILALHTGGIQGWSGIQTRFASKYDFDFVPF